MHYRRGQEGPRDSCVIGRGLGFLPRLCYRNGDPGVACPIFDNHSLVLLVKCFRLGGVLKRPYENSLLEYTTMTEADHEKYSRHTELPDVLAGRCHSPSAQVESKRPTPHVTLPHTGLPARHAAARLCPGDACKDKTYIFNDSHPNVNFIVQFVALVCYLIFYFKNDLMLIFIKIIICLYGSYIYLHYEILMTFWGKKSWE